MKRGVKACCSVAGNRASNQALNRAKDGDNRFQMTLSFNFPSFFLMAVPYWNACVSNRKRKEEGSWKKAGQL